MNAPALTRTAIDPVSGQQVEIRNDLIKRLRGQYACGPTLPNGEPEFGWRTFGEPVPIQIEAADEIDRLTTRIKVLEAIIEPFARMATDIHPMAPDEGLCVVSAVGGGIMTNKEFGKVFDLRRARAALELSGDAS